MAYKNLLQGDVLVVVGKTHLGTEKMGLREGF
jgi:K+/H+ antiporter YhaU regulatory subunit KhtT